MPLRTYLRISPAVWLSPILIILALLATNIIAPISDPYAIAHASIGAYTVFLIAPFCAACGAWEGGRLLRARWVGLTHMRSFVYVAFDLLRVTVTIGILSILLAIGVRLLGIGAFALPDGRLIAMVSVVIVAHTLLGFAIGTHVSPVIAVPTVFLLDYGWMVLPIAVEPLWLRHLNGVLSSCCTLSTTLAPQAFTAPSIVAVGLICTALLLLGRPLNYIRIGIAIVPLIMALSLGIVQVRTFGPDPVVARTDAMVCSSGSPRICLWPEHKVRLDEVTEIATDASEHWRAIGMNVPTEFSEREQQLLEPNARSFGISLASRPVDIINALAYSLTPPYPPCMDEGILLAGGSKVFLSAWFASVAGLSNADIEARYDPETIVTVMSVRKLSLEQQKAWVTGSFDAMQTCDRLPPTVPSS